MKKYSLIAFDAYGTLLDVYSINMLAEQFFPNQGMALALLWRERQIEYTRLVTMSDPNPNGSRHYQSFWDLTILSLRYSCKRLGLVLSAAHEQALMDQYAKLQAFADSLPTLKTIKQLGYQTAILSNGSVDMLDHVLKSNALSEQLDQVISVEGIRLFKTAPQAYQLLCTNFKIQPSSILFVSSNAWDALAAGWFGFDVFWLNRQSLPFEEIGPTPHYIGQGLGALIEVLTAKA